MEREFLINRVLLITGGTGSFGNAVLQRVLHSGIGEIRIFSRDEKKQDDMRRTYNSPNLKFYIGDVRNPDSVDNVMKGVDFVFHAAALKQVPSCEFFPLEAVRTNILGAENVLNAAIRNRVTKVILLSTDKAVNPINAMGMSKALMEKVMAAKARYMKDNGTVMCCTRYGNVMGSRGSVIPLFIEQIQSGKEITITDPEMTRFMMSLDEAVELVLYAFSNGKQGDIYVQKAPAATINDLAQALKTLLHKDNPIREIGTRHGEKLYETLVNREEMVKAVDLDRYYRIPIDSRDLNYEAFFSKGKNEVSRKQEYTSHNTKRLSQRELVELLKGLDFIQEAMKRG